MEKIGQYDDVGACVRVDCLDRLGLEKTDIADRILLELTDKTKTRRQIIKELKNQGLIKSTRELKLYQTITSVVHHR